MSDALRERYREERDKRVGGARTELVEIEGALAHYLDDPHTPFTPRDAIHDEVDAVVLGAGLGALIAGAELRKAGLQRIRLIDMAGDVGGVWYWNRYPGAACDVESYVYLPYLEETDYIPTSKYARASEILRHAQRVAKHFDLYELALFQTSITGARWNEAEARWEISTDRGDEIRCRYFIVSEGSFSRLRLPAVEGLESFRGEAFHTSRWNYAYTGGGPDEPPDRLSDKTVGVVGTGASAIQVIPALAQTAGTLLVFQRTPSTINVRNAKPTDKEWASGLQAGWQIERMRNFTELATPPTRPAEPDRIDLVADGWTVALSDEEKMDAARARVDEVVDDPAVAEALKPYYEYWCKRPCFHDEFLPAFNRPNVQLVDTDGKGVDRVYEHGVEVDGERFELDLLVLATGFEYGGDFFRRIGFDILGQDGQSLREKWKDGMSTLFGITTHGFPNLLIMPGSNGQSAVSVNFVHSMLENGIHIGYIVSETERHGARWFDTTQDVEDDWVRTILAHSRDSLPFLEACIPSRLNNDGRPALRPSKNANVSDPPNVHFDRLAAWRADRALKGLTFDITESGQSWQPQEQEREREHIR